MVVMLVALLVVVKVGMLGLKLVGYSAVESVG